MNRKQLQIEVCKALLDPNSRLAICEIDKNEFAVTTTGYDAFVFYEDEIVFDKSKIRKVEFLKEVFADSDKDEIVKPTGEMFKDHSKTLEKLAGENVETFVDVSIMKKFSGFRFMTDSPINRILVKDHFGRLVGCFLPVRKEIKK